MHKMFPLSSLPFTLAFRILHTILCIVFIFMFIYSFYAFSSYYKHVSIVDSLKNRTNKGFKALRLQNTKKIKKTFKKVLTFK